jgi:diguanylate cyclase (GGDEF)-like protein
VVSHDTLCDEVEALFAEDPTITSLVVEYPDGRFLLDRVRFQAASTGPFGPDRRTLLARRPVSDLTLLPCTIVPACTVVGDAVEVARSRPLDHRDVDLLVEHPDGALSTLSPDDLLEAMAWQLRHDALHDALTGLANRALLLDRLGQALERRRRARTQVAVLHLGLDSFRSVNEGLGHAAGDRVLRAVADRLSTCVRSSDSIARVGGDELEIVAECSATNDAHALAERVVSGLRAPLLLGSSIGTVRASVGLAIAKPDETPGEVLRRAEAAMGIAKRDGGDSWREPSPALDNVEDERSAAAELRQAIDAEQLELRYQPVIDLHTGDVVHLEALVRWPQPDGTERSPAAFIPLAERSGLIHELGDLVLRQALTQLRDWDATLIGQEPHAVSVNVSPIQLEDPALAERVLSSLHASSIAADRLCLEITETALMRDPALSRRTLTRLRQAGIAIAIDDFGVGTSSLATLARLPVTELKLDRAFTLDIDDPVENRVAAAVVALADELGLDVVAEGIETPAQAAWVHSLGVRLAQGFLFARPMRAEDVPTELAPRPAAGIGEATA